MESVFSLCPTIRCEGVLITYAEKNICTQERASYRTLRKITPTRVSKFLLLTRYI
jgi:hypothetical protein